ncbi:phage baseplate assembly protein domain-containing protein [Bradyrhizobium sp. AZCC 2289]|uniref:phage baseplate assembly protein domain-containing protein n=1 Tax=Bradyrhizobium sp. AZCC 2289 TaxID=3117026 RepID=UPI002FF04A20
MHRATPLNSSMRGYCGGGARSCVDQVDDTTLMQSMAGNFMANETRKEIEAPQNYGFTSVVFDAERGQDGKIQACAETFVGFMGSNRSLPVTGNMDDRRHRLYKLEKGDTAMFRGRGDKQQFHLTQDGGFWTAPQDKTLRMHLVQQDSESNATVQQGGGGSASSGGAAPALRDGSTSNGSSGSGQQGGGQKRGQEALYKEGQKSPLFVEITKDKTRISGKTSHMALDDGNTYVHCNTDKNVYLGAEAGKGSFDFVATLSGPCVNTLGKIG